MMQALIPKNIAWFSEFFTDLLLQIGLVPMQETDADILRNVSDKDKLQVCAACNIPLTPNTFVLLLT